MKTSEACANGCIPSNPRMGCPVHAAKCTCVADFVVYGTCDYCRSRPKCPHGGPAPRFGEVLDCGCSGGPSAFLTGMQATPPPPPEPAPDEHWLPNEAVRELVANLRAQLAAAQARFEDLRTTTNGALDDYREKLQAATERAEKAERERFDAVNERNQARRVLERMAVLEAERDAAIKAKEEAEQLHRDVLGDCQDWFEQSRALILERDAERKRADEAQKEEEAESTHLNQLWQAARAETKQAQAAAEALRAALKSVHGKLHVWHGSFGEEKTRAHQDADKCHQPPCDIINEALAAHSKAVGP